MSDRIWVRAEPLSEAEQAERFDRSTRIQIEHQASRHAIRREWVRDAADDGTSYGYAEFRGTERNSESVLDLKVPGPLDVIALTKAILAEIARQGSLSISKGIFDAK